MLTLAQPTPRLPNQYYPDSENVRQYFSAQIRQLSPERSLRATIGQSPVRRSGLQPSEKPMRRSASTVTGKSTTNPASAGDTTSATQAGTTKTGALLRSNTDVVSRQQSLPERPDPTEEWEMRHGYDEQYNSTKYLEHLSSVSGLDCHLFMSTTPVVANSPPPDLFHVLHRQAARDGRETKAARAELQPLRMANA